MLKNHKKYNTQKTKYQGASYHLMKKSRLIKVTTQQLFEYKQMRWKVHNAVKKWFYGQWNLKSFHNHFNHNWYWYLIDRLLQHHRLIEKKPLLDACFDKQTLYWKKIRVSKKILMKAIYPTIKANDYNRTFKREIRLKRL